VLKTLRAFLWPTGCLRWVIRYKCDPAASSAMPAVTATAEANSERRVNPNLAARAAGHDGRCETKLQIGFGQPSKKSF